MSASHQLPLHPSQGPQARPLILVVDDDSSVRDLTGTMLELHGYSVLRAATAEEAVSLFEQHGMHITLLVIDVVMPTVSGPCIARQLRLLRPNLPVLFVSGLVSHNHDKDEMGEWFIRKPFSQRRLVTKIKELLSHLP